MAGRPIAPPKVSSAADSESRTDVFAVAVNNNQSITEGSAGFKGALVPTSKPSAVVHVTLYNFKLVKSFELPSSQTPI